MLNKREILGGVAGLASVTFAPDAWASAQNMLSAADIKSDLALLQSIYETLHPGLYRYNSKAQIAARFRALSSRITGPRSLAQTYLDFSLLLASVRCGHSYANFYSQSDAVKAALFEGTNRLPFTFEWIDRQMIVLNPAGIDGLARGSVITHINGVPTSRILETLIPYVRADGNNVGKQISLLSVKRAEGYQTFDIFYALHYGPSDRFTLRGRNPSGRAFTQEVRAIDLAARRAQTAVPALAPGAAPWTLELVPNESAIMTMPSWGLYRSAFDWKAWLANAFTQINAASPKTLLIDLRGNEGGNDEIGPEVLSYLTDKPVAPQAGKRRVAYRTIPAALNPFLDTWDDRFRDWGDHAVLQPDGLYDLTDTQGQSGAGAQPKGILTKPMSKIILTDAAISSATLQFCQMAVQNKIAGTFGETTGGNMRGINAEKFMFARLPKTGLEVDVPLVGFFVDGDQPNGGLRPTISVQRTAKSIADNKDTTKEVAMAAGERIYRLINRLQTR
jgi:hypothetical protein